MRYDQFKPLPRFLKEASNLTAAELNKYPERIALLLKKIQSQSPFTTVDGSQVVIDPSEFDRMKAVTDTGPLKGTINLKTTDGEYINTGKFVKTGEFGGYYRAAGDAAEERIKYNKGEVAEGFHAAAAFARLIERPSKTITRQDLLNVVSKLQNGKTLKLKAKEVNSDIADEFHITISLKPGSWDSFKDPKVAEDMGTMLDVIVQDANNETARFADTYQKNGRFDWVRIIGDGISGESETKTDITFANETEKKFAEYSLKVGTTRQIHQVGGGAMSLTMEDRYNILQNGLFNVDSKFELADISGIKDQFLKQDDKLKAQELAYRAAVNSMNTQLQTEDQEKTYVKKLAKALKYWMVREDDNIQLKQFTKRYSYILDAKKFDQLHDENLDLVAEYVDNKATPELFIKDVTSGKKLVTIRTYRNSAGYIRNYIEKEPLFITLTKVTR